MNQMIAERMQLDNNEIQKRAHSIWEQEGRPEGRSLNHWLMAEKQLCTEKQASNADNIDDNSPVVAVTEPSTRKETRARPKRAERARPPIFSHRPAVSAATWASALDE
jgi:hypothetical protein